MDKQLTIRRPVPQKHHGFSTVSKVFFGMDIFQVVIVVIFQSIMIGCGNFNAYNRPEDPGMGPGRRIYMCVYMGVIVYTCFLCLFAVKQQNFLEILAFLLQNFGFVAYGLIQVYHVGYKEMPLREGSNTTVAHSSLLRKIALANSLTLFVLNGIFIFLSWKLYIEFGWKIYKRVRFNLALRSIYHFYQFLSCLLKMAILYWWMYAICNSLVLLRDYQSVMYYVNLAFVPASILYAFVGYMATQREIRTLMALFILWTLGLIGYFIYKLYGFFTDTCNGCKAFHQTGKDIHEEAMMHLAYLGILNLFLMCVILGVSCKVFSNFGKGLAQHFKPEADTRRPRLGTDLYLRRLSHLLEESVISATSYESEHDELQESMRLGYQHVILTSGAPLLTSSHRLLASSLPNFFEPEQKAQTFPGVKERIDKTSTTNSIRCHLDVIAEDDDSKNGDVGNVKERKTSKTIRKLKIESKANGNKTNEIRINGVNERSASCPLKETTLSNISKDSRTVASLDTEVGDDDVFVDRSDCERDSRDSGFMDSLQKSQNDVQMKLKTRKMPIKPPKDVSNGHGKMNEGDEKVDDRSRTNGIRAQISLFNEKTIT